MLLQFSIPIEVEFDVSLNSGITILPIRMGIPFPIGAMMGLDDLFIVDQYGRPVRSQFQILATWEDKSIRWGIVEFLYDSQNSYRLCTGSKTSIPSDTSRIKVATNSAYSFHLKHELANVSLELNVKLSLADQVIVAESTDFAPCAEGPIRFSWKASLSFPRKDSDATLVGELVIHTFADSNLLQFELLIRNPAPADHPAGNWDLGNNGSVLIRDLSIECSLLGGFEDTLINATLGKGFEPLHGARSVSIFQASSGGENWNSTNHLDRNREVPMRFRGFQCEVDGKSISGDRAEPVVSVQFEDKVVSVAYPCFWQSFPKSIRASGDSISLGLFPQESGYLHELQGGEQKTHKFSMEIRTERDLPQITSVHEPVICHLPLEFYQKSGCIDDLPIIQPDPQGLYSQLVNLAVEGQDSFFEKRERIDQYGWRNFGDIYGDHEAVYHDGHSPMISHYNNQYDCTAGFAFQFINTGDRRWWTQMIEMADHAWDIDTYHTDQDKLLYNGGLFWHTYHYADADTGNHRSYPRSLRGTKELHKGKDLAELGSTGQSLQKVYAVGGGPAASHNYPTGWMITYFLTGEDRYRAAAINAADYVLRIEDGSKTPFRWLCKGDTGYATCSSDNYYGPGRASGNSTHALLTGYELSLDSKYLNMASRLMRRTVHPLQDLNSLDLLNAELRWFYTMYLQSLCRYIEVLRRLDSRQNDLQYAVESLMHYARWMEQFERPTLDSADQLQYPNETWAAQDMRKWHVLAYASKWADSDDESKRLMSKAEFFYHHSLETLNGFATKSLCRPVVLLLNFGWQRDALIRSKRVEKSWGQVNWPSFTTFIPQKQIAIARAKKILIGGMMCGLLAVACTIVWLIFVATR